MSAGANGFKPVIDLPPDWHGMTRRLITGDSDGPLERMRLGLERRGRRPSTVVTRLGRARRFAAHFLLSPEPCLPVVAAGRRERSPQHGPLNAPTSDSFRPMLAAYAVAAARRP